MSRNHPHFRIPWRPEVLGKVVVSCVALLVLAQNTGCGDHPAARVPGQRRTKIHAELPSTGCVPLRAHRIAPPGQPLHKSSCRARYSLRSASAHRGLMFGSEVEFWWCCCRSRLQYGDAMAVCSQLFPHLVVCFFYYFMAWYASLVLVDTGTRLACARLLALPGVCNRPWSLRGSRDGNWRTVVGARFAPFPYTRHGPFSPCTVTVHGAAGHNRWGVVETPLPVKTQGRNMDRSFKWCSRVSFNGSAREVPSRQRHVQSFNGRRAHAQRWKPNGPEPEHMGRVSGVPRRSELHSPLCDTNH